MKHPLCRTHYREALDHDPYATREDYYRASFPLCCVFCQHDAAEAMHSSRSTLEAAERAWATGRDGAR